MTYEMACERLKQWEQRSSSLLVHFSVTEGGAIVFAKIISVLDDGVRMRVNDNDATMMRVSLNGTSFEEFKPDFPVESLTIKYPSGECSFMELSRDEDEWPSLIGEFEK